MREVPPVGCRDRCAWPRPQPPMADASVTARSALTTSGAGSLVGREPRMLEWSNRCANRTPRLSSFAYRNATLSRKHFQDLGSDQQVPQHWRQILAAFTGLSRTFRGIGTPHALPSATF